MTWWVVETNPTLGFLASPHTDGRARRAPAEGCICLINPDRDSRLDAAKIRDLLGARVKSGGRRSGDRAFDIAAAENIDFVSLAFFT